ncbi:hypothetical protein T439DRAFT_353191 [Meredithblackwellia eburnea MCA 4105]
MSNSPVNMFKGNALAQVLAAYSRNIESRPILTKSLTSATLYFISERVAAAVAYKGREAGAESKKNGKRTGPSDVLAKSWRKNEQAVKLAAYGALLAAPIDHYLYNLLDKVFEGKTSKRWKVAMIAASNLTILPLQNAIYLAVMTIIDGGRSRAAIFGTLKENFLPVMQLTSIISTLSMVIAQGFVPVDLWVPFFTVIAACVDTVVNIQTKQAALAAAKRDNEEKRAP